MRTQCLAAVLGTLTLLAAIQTSPGADRPTVLRVPNGGIQPQAVLDDKGALHLIYLKGPEGACDVFYVRREPGKDRFSAPIRVNSQANSAIAVGTIRGAQLALGKNNRVHVAWNGNGKSMPQGPGKGTPMLYSRLDDKGAAFEPQRNLMTQSYLLDGGGTVAADGTGNVYVAWHAQKFDPENPPKGEATRRVWLARSTDDGKTFSAEVPVNKEATGACGCCGMKGFVDSKGIVHFLYRAAAAGVNRDIYLLSSKDQGKMFSGTLVQRWKINGCPMSSEAFTEGPRGVFAAWETEGQVSFAKLAAGDTELGKPVAAPGQGDKRKHPALASNEKGETILVWTEGTDWNRGGSLAWQVFDKEGKPTEQRGRVDGGIPVWGLPTVVADRDGRFVILH